MIKPKSLAAVLAEKADRAMEKVAEIVTERAKQTQTPVITWDHKTGTIVKTYPASSK